MNMAFPAGISQILGLDAPSILRESGKNHTDPFWFTLHERLGSSLGCLSALMPNVQFHHLAAQSWYETPNGFESVE